MLAGKKHQVKRGLVGQEEEPVLEGLVASACRMGHFELERGRQLPAGSEDINNIRRKLRDKAGKGKLRRINSGADWVPASWSSTSRGKHD